MTHLHILPRHIDIEHEGYALHGYINCDSYREAWFKIEYLNDEIRDIIEVIEGTVPSETRQYLCRWMVLAHKRLQFTKVAVLLDEGEERQWKNTRF